MKRQIQIQARWTNEQMEYLISKRAGGVNIPKICKGLNKEFNVDYTVRQLYSKITYLKTQGIIIDKPKSEKLVYMRYSQDKVDFVYACVSNNFPNYIIIKGFREQFDETLSERQINYIIGTKRPTGANLEQSIKPVPTKKPKAANEVIEVIVSEVIEETTPEEVKRSRTRHHWTKEEEFNLVCNFYELSIDEVRETFQRPFYAIAKRLELIVDSSEPEYISMLMEATKVIKSRKKLVANNNKSGFLKRRKQRKQAQKIAKMEKRLSKMRGE